eukprot:CAMPEP_0118947566 /NCGR_PEP_ID=MMETSP1169-20130426/46283_1 /TAXON_ID=36882 /ORGANISM="Pyramimonas obovata, Strain CCMP722" /LENGTH=42 /DNA_ID= /DNA_START= /DNA_END= /DNA_ORIENTATION=
MIDDDRQAAHCAEMVYDSLIPYSYVRQNCVPRDCCAAARLRW